MAAATRIYIVTNKDTNEKRLVRGVTSVSARNHIAKDQLDVKVAGQDELVELVMGGTSVEDVAPAEAAED